MDKTFLKWAGGKNWFIKHQAFRLPTNYNTYIEPFLGGGSVYFYMEPEQAILSDTNEELVITFNAIKYEWQKVYTKLIEHSRKHSKEYYYKIRDYRPRTESNIAARLIYLNRTCFNGIYRVNRLGKFNVPIGTHTNVLLESDVFELRSALLQNADLYALDFEVTINLAQAGDFLFCDPPYTVQHNNNGFINYNERLFTWDDQIRLAGALHRAKDRGVQIILTNANHNSVRELYQSEGFILDSVSRYSSISGIAGSRKQYEELIVSSNII